MFYGDCSRLYLLTKVSDELSVYLIGFRQLADGTGKASNVQRIGDNDGKALFSCGKYEGVLQATSGFNYDAGWLVLFYPLECFAYLFDIITDGEILPNGAYENIELSLGGINTEIYFIVLQLVHW